MAKCLILLCLLVAVTFVVAGDGNGGNDYYGYLGGCGNELHPGVAGKRKRNAVVGGNGRNGGRGYYGGCGNEYSPGDSGKRKRSAEVGGHGVDGGNRGSIRTDGIMWTINKRSVYLRPGDGGCTSGVGRGKLG